MVVAAIPAFGEESKIADFVKLARTCASKVIVCDDGSDKKTGETAKSSGAIVVRHARDLGYGAALSTLFKEARKLNPDVMVTLDGDGQQPPPTFLSLSKFVKPTPRDGTDAVIGSRFLMQLSKGKLPAYRRIGNNSNNKTYQQGLICWHN